MLGLQAGEPVSQDLSKCRLVQLLVGGLHVTPTRAAEIADLLAGMDALPVQHRPCGGIISAERLRRMESRGFVAPESASAARSSTYLGRPLVQEKELPAPASV